MDVVVARSVALQRRDFVDFSTLKERHRTCLREIEINARTAPDIYLDVLAVNETDGT